MGLKVFLTICAVLCAVSARTILRAPCASPVLEIAPVSLCYEDILPCNKQPIQPPCYLELPCGLGYLPAAAPVVASAYGSSCGCDGCCAKVPVTTGCSCTALATPVCPNLAPLVRTIIL